MLFIFNQVSNNSAGISFAGSCTHWQIAIVKISGGDILYDYIHAIRIASTFH